MELITPAKVVDYILENIAIEGLEGQDILRVWELAKIVLKQEPDELLKGIIWFWIVKETDKTEVLVDNEPVQASPKLGDMVARYGDEIKIRPTQRYQWAVLTGLDHELAERITQRLLSIIVVVASRKEKGIMTMDISRETGQDSRSLGNRIKALIEMKIVFKFYLAHAPFPLIVHRKYKSVFYGEPTKQNGKHVEMKPHVYRRKLVQLVKLAENQIRNVVDLRAQLKISKATNKRFIKHLSFLVHHQFLQKVMAPKQHDDKKQICVAFVRDYDIKEEDEENEENEEDLEDMQDEDTFANDDVSEMSTITTRDTTEDTLGVSNTPKKPYVGSYNTYLPFVTQVIYHVLNSESGLISSELAALLVGLRQPGKLTEYSQEMVRSTKTQRVFQDKCIEDFYIGYVLAGGYFFEGKAKLIKFMSYPKYATGLGIDIVPSAYEFFSDKVERRFSPPISYQDLAAFNPVKFDTTSKLCRDPTTNKLYVVFRGEGSALQRLFKHPSEQLPLVQRKKRGRPRKLETPAVVRKRQRLTSSVKKETNGENVATALASMSDETETTIDNKQTPRSRTRTQSNVDPEPETNDSDNVSNGRKRLRRSTRLKPLTSKPLEDQLDNTSLIVIETPEQTQATVKPKRGRGRPPKKAKQAEISKDVDNEIQKDTENKIDETSKDAENKIDETPKDTASAEKESNSNTTINEDFETTADSADKPTRSSKRVSGLLLLSQLGGNLSPAPQSVKYKPFTSFNKQRRLDAIMDFLNQQGGICVICKLFIDHISSVVGSRRLDRKTITRDIETLVDDNKIKTKQCNLGKHKDRIIIYLPNVQVSEDDVERMKHMFQGPTNKSPATLVSVDRSVRLYSIEPKNFTKDIALSLFDLTENISKDEQGKQRIKPKAKTTSNENKKVSDENKKVSDENKKISDANEKVSDENEKNVDENEKISNENEKISDEHEKISNESKKKSDENKKKSDESEKLFDEIKKISDENKKKSDKNNKLSKDTKAEKKSVTNQAKPSSGRKKAARLSTGGHPLSKEDAMKLLRGVIITRTLTPDSVTDFDMICKYLNHPVLTDADMVFRKWARVRKMVGRGMLAATSEIWRKVFLKSVTDGIITLEHLLNPQLEFFMDIWMKNNIDDYGSKGEDAVLQESRQAAKETSTRPRMYVNHQFILDNYVFNGHFAEKNFETYFSPVMSSIQKENHLLKTSFTLTDKKPKQQTFLDIKQTLKAILLSDPTKYSPSAVKTLLHNKGFSEMATKTAIIELDNDRIVSALMIDSKPRLAMNSRVWLTLGSNLPESFFHDAAQFHQLLYSILDRNRGLLLSSIIPDGVAALLINYIVQNKISLLRLTKPLGDVFHSFSAKSLDESVFECKFVLTFKDSSIQQEALPPIPIPTGPSCSRIWIDVEGNINKSVFKKVLISLISLLTKIPGISRTAVLVKLQQLLSRQELDEVCDWAIKKKCFRQGDFESLFLTGDAYTLVG